MEVTPAQLIALLREGTAPVKARAAIARGALPLPPAILLESLDILADDPDPAIQAEAAATFGRLPATVVRGVVSSPAIPPDLLAHLARRYAGNEAVTLDIARNAAADDDTFAWLATLPFPSVLEVIGRNQVRLERSAGAVSALLSNAATPSALLQLWQEHLERQAAAAAAVAAAREPEPEAYAEEAETAFDSALVDEDESGAAAPATAEEAEAQSARKLSVLAMLKNMSMGQKVGIASKGNREVRNILIHENNKMICLKVLENPRLGENDVEAYAKSTNVSLDVLRGIAMKKEWVKKYAIVKALVMNPKVPIGITMDFIKRLTKKDLEQLAKNRNVPEVIRTTARKALEVKKKSPG